MQREAEQIAVYSTMADCPSQIVTPDPHGTGDHWYRWVEHGCRDWAGIKPRRDMQTRSSAAKETV